MLLLMHEESFLETLNQGTVSTLRDEVFINNEPINAILFIDYSEELMTKVFINYCGFTYCKQFKSDKQESGTPNNTLWIRIEKHINFSN